MATINQVRVKGVVYDLEDSTARANVPDMSAINTAISNLDSTRVKKAGDTMSGALTMSAAINLNGGDLNVASGRKIVFSRASSEAVLQTGDGTLLMRAGTDSDNYCGIRADMNQKRLEFATKEEGTAKDYVLDYYRRVTFSGSSITAETRHEYFNSTDISVLNITWPTLATGIIFSVCFSAGSSFSGINHSKSNGSSFTAMKWIGESPTQASTWYNIVCWYDGGRAWCAVKC